MSISPGNLGEILDAAAVIAMSYFDRGVDVELKADGSPATEADRKINDYLETALRRLFPAAGWLSEETADTSQRLGGEWTWIVDPLDGTREFVKGVREFAISVGLVRGRRAVAGAVSNPATGQCGVVVEGCPPEFRGFGATNPPPAKIGSSVAVVSRSEAVRGEIAPYVSLFSEVRPVGSVAYKLLLVAAGASDLTFSVQPKNEWDICGGVALVEAAGLSYRRFDGCANTFNHDRPLVDSGAVAATGELVDEFLSATTTIRRSRSGGSGGDLK